MSKAKAKLDYDAIVMGGGPAGSCVSALLALQGRRVLVVEKDIFPRYHVGESLIPETYWPLRRMGVIDKIKEAGFTKKFSVQFANPAGRYSKPFYFFETNHHESAVTWQVDRARFDKLLLDHAREIGVDVREGWAVRDVIFEGERAIGVEAAPTGQNLKGGARRFQANVIVDATGLQALLAGKLGLRIRDPKLKKASVYGYFQGATRDAGVDRGATLILRTPAGNGWFWFLPLAGGVTSVGVVADPDYLLRDRGKDYEKILLEEIQRCKGIQPRMQGARRIQDVHVISDFSYRSTRCAGPGYVLIGDAYGFLDPVYSSGVYLALKSAEMAADAIGEAFTHNDFSEKRLGAFGVKLKQGIESFRKLVYVFYAEGFSFGQFMMKHPESRENLIDLLVGNVLREGIDEIFERMKEFCEIPEPLDDAQPRASHLKERIAR